MDVKQRDRQVLHTRRTSAVARPSLDEHAQMSAPRKGLGEMKRNLTALLLLGMTSVTSAGRPADDLVLWYTFEDVAGKVVKDRSGHGNHGTVHGAGFVKLGDGVALELDGVDDYNSRSHRRSGS